jgi:excisionase family DNA binding protein
VTKPKNETTTEKRLLTVNEVAKVLGYRSVGPIYKLIADGEIPVVNLPTRGGTRIEKKDLDVFIERRKRAA